MGMARLKVGIGVGVGVAALGSDWMKVLPEARAARAKVRPLILTIRISSTLSPA